MTLPPFLHRIAAAAAPLLGGLDETAIGARLEATTVALRTDAATAAVPGHRAGYLFAVNLAARLYPHLLLDAPADLAAETAALARRIHADVTVDHGEPDAELLWRPGVAGPAQVTVACDGWLVRIDHDDATFGPSPGAVALAAAALGMSQVFRAVFATDLELGRTAARPWSLHLVTLGDEGPDVPVPDEVDLGTVHLAGCGAIGQAAAAALAELPVRGRLVAVDPDPLDAGNLQRYVLSFADDVDQDKPGLIERALAGTAIDVDPVISRWGDDERSGVGATTVLAALDTPEDRIEVQASLPREIYNAWTDPEHTGVSRHERFGVEPCLACLYWPRRPRPSRSERLARELGEHELRVLRHLVDEIPAGSPLPAPVQGTLRLPAPPEAVTWTQRSLLDDFGARHGIDPSELVPYRGLPIDFLHRDRVCARLTRRDSQDKEVSVPLAHQSALAGALLAITLLVARSPELAAHRPAQEAQARYDVLVDNPQWLPSTVARRPRCICHDPDYVKAYRRRFNEVA